MPLIASIIGDYILDYHFHLMPILGCHKTTSVHKPRHKMVDIQVTEC